MGQARVAQQFLARDENPVGDVARVPRDIRLTGKKGSADGLYAVRADDQIGLEDLAVLCGGARRLEIVGCDTLVGKDFNAGLQGRIEQSGVQVRSMDKPVRRAVCLDDIFEGQVKDGAAILPADEVISL